MLSFSWERTLAVVRVLVTLSLLTGLFFVFGFTPGDLVRAIRTADDLQLGLGFVALSVLLLLLSLKWWVITRGLGVTLSFFAATRLYLTGTVLNNVLPTAIGGDLYRVYFLSRESDSGFRRSLASVLIERATGYAGLLALSAPAAAFYFWGVVPGLAVILALLAGSAVAYLLLRRRRADPEPDVGETWRWTRLPATSNLYSVAALSVVQQSLWVSTAAIFGLAYGVSIPWSYWVLTVTALTLLTMLPVSVGGLGLREVGYAAVLAPVGVDATKAAAIGLAMGLGPSVVSLVGLVAFVVSGFPRQSSLALGGGEISPSASRAKQ